MDASTAIAGVQPGDILADKYRIDRVLGAGAMGVVVAAHHIKLDDRVAIKFLLPETLSNGEAVARFEREARAAVKIKSEHVARVTDVGTLDTGAPYMVMEYLEGGDLEAWLQGSGPLPVEQAVEFILQACEAIAEAHGLGIVHRDLKPANLFVVRRADGLLSVKVLDFGISKVTDRFSSIPPSRMTKTTSALGSPLYMSPEQLNAPRDVDSRIDIWALGVILFELVAGCTPWTADTFPELVLRIVNAPVPPVRTHRPDAPEELDRVIGKCLEKNRDQRYANVAELAVALAPLGPRRARASAERASRIIQASGLSASAVVFPPSSDATRTMASGYPASGTQGAWGQTSRPLARGAAVGAIAAVVLAALGGVVLWRATSRRADIAPAAAVNIGAAPAAAQSAPAQPAAVAQPVEISPVPVPALPASANASPAEPVRALPAVLRPGAGGRAVSRAPAGATSTPPPLAQSATVAAAPPAVKASPAPEPTPAPKKNPFNVQLK